MSSSSALMVAVFLALAHVNDLAAEPAFQSNIHNPTDLAGYLGTVENGQTFGSLVGDRGVGTFGGSEDHTAMLCSLPGRVSQYAYCPVRFERAIALPSGYTFAVAVSGVAAEKTGAAMEKYNAASRLASALTDLWRRRTGRSDPHLAAILANGPEALTRLRETVHSAGASGVNSALLLQRLEHFVAENERILPAAGDCLECEDVAGFGRLVSQSQEVAETLLGNQIPETSYLAHCAPNCGAVAASAFGAGFGGSVWALVEENRVGPFLNSWAQAYRSRFPERVGSASFFQTGAGPAAMQIA
jgi:galactokinase